MKTETWAIRVRFKDDREPARWYRHVSDCSEVSDYETREAAEAEVAYLSREYTLCIFMAVPYRPRWRHL